MLKFQFKLVAVLFLVLFGVYRGRGDPHHRQSFHSYISVNGYIKDYIYSPLLPKIFTELKSRIATELDRRITLDRFHRREYAHKCMERKDLPKSNFKNNE